MIRRSRFTRGHCTAHEKRRPLLSGVRGLLTRATFATLVSSPTADHIARPVPAVSWLTMTREESWEVEGTTLTLLRHISSLGYAVSVFRFHGSLLGSRPANIEM